MSDDVDLPPETPPGITPPSLLGRMRTLVVDLTPLRTSRQFRLLWTGETISDMGSHITAVAVPYQVFLITRSSLAVGLLALWALYVFATLSAAAYALYSPAVRSAPPLLFPKEDLPSVFALRSVSYNLGSLAGPAVGGLLIATIGFPGTYLVDAASFLVSLATLSIMDPLPQAGHEVPKRFVDALREGFRFLKGRPVLRSTFTFDLDAMIFGMPMALLPAMAFRLGGGARTAGLLYAAPNAGSILITLLSGRAKHVRRQGQAVMASIVVWGAAIVAFGLSRSLWLALLALAVAGAADMWSGIFRTTIAQAVVPDAMRGRLSGIELAVVATGPSIGDLEAGVVGSLVSVPFSIVSGGIACIAGVFVLGLLVPEFARYDARNPTP